MDRKEGLEGKGSNKGDNETQRHQSRGKTRLNFQKKRKGTERIGEGRPKEGRVSTENPSGFSEAKPFGGI